MTNSIVPFLRYPGSKRRLLALLQEFLPEPANIDGEYVEPFIGGGAVFFHMRPPRALLSDINSELIELYRGIKADYASVWAHYASYPPGKDDYFRIRNQDVSTLDLAARAARALFLNRTCFNGMWRHNRLGRFNVGYGGGGRRWAISEEALAQVSALLSRATLVACDFEEVIENCSRRDFVFLDPPYKPGARELTHQHYVGQTFCYGEQIRLAAALDRARNRGTRWLMTNTSHPEVLALYPDCRIVPLPFGTGRRPGLLQQNSGEVLIISTEES